MFLHSLSRALLRLGLALTLLTGFVIQAQAACLGVSRSVNVSSFNPHLGASPSGGIGLRHKEVVLTFDDGPNAGTTNRVLAALRKECTKATFFVVGRMVRSNPGLLKQAKRAGHTIAHHSYDHANLSGRSSAAVRSSILRGMGAVDAALGRGQASRMFRYPYLARSARTDKVVRSLGLLPLSAGIDSLDWKGGDFVGRTMRQLARKGRGVILLHDLKSGTARKLPQLLARLRQGGYKVVHMRGGRSKTPGSARIASLDKKKRGKGLTLSVTPRKDRRRAKSVSERSTKTTRTSNVTIAKKRGGFFSRLRKRRVAAHQRERGESGYRAPKSVRVAKLTSAYSTGTARNARKTTGKTARKTTVRKRRSFLEWMRSRHEARVGDQPKSSKKRRARATSKKAKSKVSAKVRAKARAKKAKAKTATKRPSFLAKWRARVAKQRTARLAKARKKRIARKQEFALSLATLNPQVNAAQIKAELASIAGDAMTDFDAVSELQKAVPGLDVLAAEAVLNDAQEVLASIK